MQTESLGLTRDKGVTLHEARGRGGLGSGKRLQQEKEKARPVQRCSPEPPLSERLPHPVQQDRKAGQHYSQVPRPCGLRVRQKPPIEGVPGWGPGQPQPGPVLSQSEGEPSRRTIQHQAKLTLWRVWVGWENRRAPPRVPQNPNPRGSLPSGAALHEGWAPRKAS